MHLRSRASKIVMIDVKPSLERQALEVASYQRGQAQKGYFVSKEGYLVSKKLGVRMLFHIKPR